jgi:hypothetical protein
MAVREAQASPAAGTEAPGAASVSGYVDRIDGCTVTGWAWCRARPDATVEIEIRIDEQPVATTRADRFRRDLADAQIGDGRHAFEATLGEPVTAETRGRIAVFGRLGAAEPFVALVNRTTRTLPPARRPVGAGAPVNDAALMEALQSLVQALSGLRRETGDLGKAVHGIAESADDTAETIAGLARQVAAIEVFQARIDGVLARLEGCDAAGGPGARRERGLAIAVGLSGVLALASLGFGLAAVLG